MPPSPAVAFQSQGKIGPSAKLSDVVVVLEPKEELEIPLPEPVAVPQGYGAGPVAGATY